MSESKFYSVNQVAEMVDMHPKTIRRYIGEGTLKARKVGGQWRVMAEDLRQFMDVDESFQKEQANHWQEEILGFIDGGGRKGKRKIEVLSIIDFFSDSIEEVKDVSNALLEVINNKAKEEAQTKFRYQYEPEENKARFILKGSPEYVAQMLMAIQKKEG